MDSEEKKRRADLIVQQYDGIVPQYEALYISSLLYSANRARMSFDALDAALKDVDDPNVAMAHLQEALSHASSVSRYFWPTRRDNYTQSRAIKLRDAFEVSDTNPLKDRHLRNAIEHFDERLDDFLLNCSAGPVVPGAIIGDFAIIEESVGHVFKLIDPEHGVCVILGTICRYFPVRCAVVEVSQRAERMDRDGARLMRP